jgi:hypothetical protein
MSLNLKFKPHDTYNKTKQVQDFIQACTVHSGALFNTIVAIVTPGCHNPSSPITEILTQDLEGAAALQE